MCSACVLWLNAYSYFPVLSSVHEISCVSVLRTSLNSPALGQDTWGPETDCQGLAALQKSWKPFLYLIFPVMEWKECSPNSAVSKTLSVLVQTVHPRSLLITGPGVLVVRKGSPGRYLASMLCCEALGMAYS